MILILDLPQRLGDIFYASGIKTPGAQGAELINICLRFIWKISI